MIHCVHKVSDILADHIVALVSKNSDISLLDFLSLDSKISTDIKKSLKKKDSSFKEYFLGGKKYASLSVFCMKDNDSTSQSNFLGKYFPKIESKKLCLIAPGSDQDLFLRVGVLSRYKYEVYKSKKETSRYEILCKKDDKKSLQSTQATIENIFLARDLWEMPASDLTPEVFADMVKKTKFKNTKVKILSYKDIQKKKLGLIEWVGKWSENKPCMVILEHIVDKKKDTLGIIGKGVTFDTGWNQIKPGDYMYDMKGDMGGAAVSYALMKELDRHKIDKNIVVCLCLAENVVSSNAYKPSDILRGYTGKTVEIIHTDAEGRLVLADGISYIWKNYKTSEIISIATLTGACMVALGFRYAGIMGTHSKFIKKCVDYSKDHTEKYVELPLADHFVEKTKSEIADYKNLDRTVHAGASMGAAFLSNFLENNEKYTHIDIAGAYINEADPYGKMPKWMTGFGVESLSEILLS